MHFPSLVGVLSMGFFIHNCIISITLPCARPEKRVRDTSIAFLLVTLTYLVVGAVFYASFPGPKADIAENFLRNFASSDALAFVARIFLLFQIVTLFPLLMFVLRIQLLNPLLGTADVGYVSIFLVNVSVIAVCLLFAVFYPHVGLLIRVTGALSGMVYVFALPALVKLAVLHRDGRASKYHWMFHIWIVALGAANLVAQFAVPP